MQQSGEVGCACMLRLRMYPMMPSSDTASRAAPPTEFSGMQAPLWPHQCDDVPQPTTHLTTSLAWAPWPVAGMKQPGPPRGCQQADSCPSPSRFMGLVTVHTLLHSWLLRTLLVLEGLQFGACCPVESNASLYAFLYISCRKGSKPSGAFVSGCGRCAYQYGLSSTAASTGTASTVLSAAPKPGNTASTTWHLACKHMLYEWCLFKMCSQVVHVFAALMKCVANAIPFLQSQL